MDKALRKYEKSNIDAGIGDTVVMSKEDIRKTIDGYKSMVSLMNVRNVKECETDTDRIKYLIKKGNILSLQEARNMLEKCPFYFINQGSVIIPEGETLEDVENYIFRSDGMYVKATKYIGNLTIMREAFTGIMCLNFLRAYLPNFACILGVWRYQRPIIYHNLKGEYDIVYTTDNRLISDYVAYEEIKGVTLQEYIELFGGKGLRNILWQICNALKLAYQTCEFYHMDLHKENIIISPNNHTYIYFKNGEIKRFETNMIAVIIDYGQSTVTYQNTQYAKWHQLNEDDDLNRDLYGNQHRIYPIRDMSFLLDSIMGYTDENGLNKESLQFVKELSYVTDKSYNMKDFDNILLRLSPDSTEQILPYIEGGKNFTPKQYPRLDEYMKQLNILGGEIASYDDGDEYFNKVISYGACMLALLSSKSFKNAMVRDIKTKLKNYLGLLKKMFVAKFRDQFIYDLYVNLLNYL